MPAPTTTPSTTTPSSTLFPGHAATTSGDGVVCQPPAGPTKPAPQQVAFLGNVWMAVDQVKASPGQAMDLTTAADTLSQAWREAVTTPGKRYLLPDLHNQMASMTLLVCGLDIECEAVSLPANHKDVPAAGAVLADAQEQDGDVQLLLGPIEETLRPSLRDADFLQRLENALGWPWRVAHAHRTRAVSAIGDIVRTRLEGKLPLIAKNPRLSIRLAPVVELLTGPGKKGQETRRENQRLVEETVTKERAKQSTNGSGTPPTGGTPPAGGTPPTGGMLPGDHSKK